jgi:hypothetical protein
MLALAEGGYVDLSRPPPMAPRGTGELAYGLVKREENFIK